jgi:hypothetical protein
LWLGLLVVGAVVNYNCKKCFDSLLSNVLCRLVYVKAKKKKKHFVTSCVLALRWISEHLLLKEKKYQTWFFVTLWKKFKNSNIHSPRQKKIKIKSEHLFKKKQTNMAFCYLIEKIQKLF